MLPTSLVHTNGASGAGFASLAIRSRDAGPSLRITATDKLTLAQQRLRSRERFTKARLAESGYAAQLRAVARQVGMIVRGFAPEGVIENTYALTGALRKYSETLHPWAQSVATRMVAEVARRDAKAWAEHGREMGRALRKEIEHAPTGEMLRRFLREQVELITSLPIEAAARVHRLTLEAQSTSGRAEQIAQEILATGDVTVSRANTIARTEVSRTASGLTMVRAKYVGSMAYVWRTARDKDVRESHRKMEGKTVQWDDPVTLDGMKGHAGMFPNCRCFSEVILPEDIS